MPLPLSPEKLKVTELRAELSARGLSPKGTKPLLIERLRSALDAANSSTDNVVTANEQPTEADTGDQEPEQSDPQESAQSVADDSAKTEGGTVGEEAAETNKENPSDVVMKEEEPVSGESKGGEQSANSADAKTDESINEGAISSKSEAGEKLISESKPGESAAESGSKKDNTDTSRVSNADTAADDSTAAIYDGNDETMAENPDTSGEDSAGAVQAKNADATVDSLEEENERILLREEGDTTPNGTDKMDEANESLLLQEERDNTANESTTAVYGGKNESMLETSSASGPNTFWADVSMESNEGFQIEGSSEESNKRPREESPEPAPTEEPKTLTQDEPEMPAESVVLDWYNSDLNLEIDASDFCTAAPLTEGGFAYMWAGARATYGFISEKVCYEVKILENLQVPHLEQAEQHPHLVRVGWSVNDSSLTLGEDQLSYGYGGTGKISTNNQFQDYGICFGTNDVVGVYLDAVGEVISISFTVNGQDQGIAFSRAKHELKNQALFPHIMTKNCRVRVNFGQEGEPWFPLKADYVLAGKSDPSSRIRGAVAPASRAECELIVMVGLPGCGKTTWALKHAQEHPDKKYNILGTNAFLEKMRVDGLPRRRNYHGRWEALIDKCTKCLSVILEKAARRRRNYILDQTNVYPNARRRKSSLFTGFQRRAVVIVPPEQEHRRRQAKREREEGKDVPVSAVLEMKANFRLPEVDDLFSAVEYTELQHNDALALIKRYSREARDLGYGMPPNKRPRQEVHQAVSNWDRDFNQGRFQAGSRRGNRSSGPPPIPSSFPRRNGPPPPQPIRMNGPPPQPSRINGPPGGYRRRSVSPPRRFGGGGGGGGRDYRPPERQLPFPWITPPPNFGAPYQDFRRDYAPPPSSLFQRREERDRPEYRQAPAAPPRQPYWMDTNYNQFGPPPSNNQGPYGRSSNAFQRRY